MPRTASLRVVQAAALVVGGTGLVSLVLGMGPAIGREGDAVQREKMSALECKPFPAEAMGGLTDWVGAEGSTPVSGGVLPEGGVVAFAFINAGNGASMTMINTLTRLQRQQGEDGLTVFAVHPDEEWEEITEKHEDGRLRIPIARDPGGKFAAALGADNDPDLYLIDRAGLLRYADIETRSLGVAIAALLRETPEEAAQNAASEGQARGIAMAEDGPAETPGNDEAGGGEGSGVDRGEYAKAPWPSVNGGSLNATNFQNKPLPVKLGGETWITPEQDLTGKVIVLDFWATWCGPCIRAMPTLDGLQKRHRGSLVVLGVGGQSDDIDTFRDYVQDSKHSYGQVFDPQQRIYRALKVRAIPHVVVMSTDGVVRWQGNPLSQDFKGAVEAVIDADPGLKANQSDG